MKVSFAPILSICCLAPLVLAGPVEKNPAVTTQPVHEPWTLPLLGSGAHSNDAYTDGHMRRKREQVANAAPALPSFDSPVPLESLGLTPKEAEVLLWSAQGKSNAETAILLGSAEATVKKHMERILQKLDVENRGAAALIAIETLSRA